MFIIVAGNMIRKETLKIMVFLFTLILTTGCEQNKPHFEPKEYDDLSGHTVCVLEGSIQQDYAMAHLKNRGIDFVIYGNATDCMLALNTGKADVFFGASLYAYNENFHRQHLTTSVLLDDIDAPFAFGVKKGNTLLLNDLNTFQDSISKVGLMRQIIDRWFDEKNTDFHSCVKIEPTTGKPSGKGRVLRVGISGVKPPTEVLIDNKWTGCEIEILQRYAASRGIQLDIQVFDFGNLIPAIQSGKIDVTASTLAINDERKAKIDFCNTYASVKASFIIPDPKYHNDTSFLSGIKESVRHSVIVEKRWKLLLGGLWITILISVMSLILGSVLGGGLCWMTMNDRRWIRGIGKTYLYVVRNIPMLVLLMIMFYVVLANTGLPTVVVAIIAFGMNSAAYISEIYRTGIQSVDVGQREAAQAMGFSRIQTFFWFVAPIAIHKALPVYKNEAVSLLKGTSVVGYISIIDLTKASDLIRSASFEALIPLVVISVAYFLLAFIMTSLIDMLAKRV